MRRHTESEQAPTHSPTRVYFLSNSIVFKAVALLVAPIGCRLRHYTPFPFQEKERGKRRRAKGRRKQNKLKQRAQAEAEENAKQVEEEESCRKDQCSSCKKPIMDRKPLYLFDMKVCSSKCAQELRRHLQAEAAEKRMLSLA